jgi:hypothetical protein
MRLLEKGGSLHPFIGLGPACGIANRVNRAFYYVCTAFIIRAMNHHDDEGSTHL